MIDASLLVAILVLAGLALRLRRQRDDARENFASLRKLNADVHREKEDLRVRVEALEHIVEGRIRLEIRGATCGDDACVSCRGNAAIPILRGKRRLQ